MADDELGLQFHQLPMFMSAREIQRDYTPGDRMGKLGDDADKRVWRSKGSDARARKLRPQIAQEGVHMPVELNVGDHQVYDGHHRVAVSASVAPDRLMPVLHHPTHSFRHKLAPFSQAWPSL